MACILNMMHRTPFPVQLSYAQLVKNLLMVDREEDVPIRRMMIRKIPRFGLKFDFCAILLLDVNATSSRLTQTNYRFFSIARGMTALSCEILFHALCICLGCNTVFQGQTMLYWVSENMALYDILNEFQKGHSHIAVVYRNLNESSVRQRMRPETSNRTGK
ncbi:hypothetical protein RJ641_028994 [Dillenia turbinata]|uniref:Uncharacterized protein n=1 Tax=Dillenia turbinata TaxID=194707 RepID=A0AAN8W3U4_9MAGN